MAAGAASCALEGRVCLVVAAEMSQEQKSRLARKPLLIVWERDRPLEPPLKLAAAHFGIFFDSAQFGPPDGIRTYSTGDTAEDIAPGVSELPIIVRATDESTGAYKTCNEIMVGARISTEWRVKRQSALTSCSLGDSSDSTSSAWDVSDGNACAEDKLGELNWYEGVIVETKSEIVKGDKAGLRYLVYYDDNEEHFIDPDKTYHVILNLPEQGFGKMWREAQDLDVREQRPQELGSSDWKSERAHQTVPLQGGRTRKHSAADNFDDSRSDDCDDVVSPLIEKQPSLGVLDTSHRDTKRARLYPRPDAMSSERFSSPEEDIEADLGSTALEQPPDSEKMVEAKCNEETLAPAQRIAQHPLTVDSSKDAAANRSKLFISDIPTRVSNKGLQVAFSSFGKVIAFILLAKEGMSTGCAFVEFADPQVAANVVAHASNPSFKQTWCVYENDTDSKPTDEITSKFAAEFLSEPLPPPTAQNGLMSSPAEADISTCPAGKRLIVSNIPTRVSEKGLHSAFSCYGKVEHSTLLRKDGVSTGCGFITFSEPKIADHVVTLASNPSFVLKWCVYENDAHSKPIGQCTSTPWIKYYYHDDTPSKDSVLACIRREQLALEFKEPKEKQTLCEDGVLGAIRRDRKGGRGVSSTSPALPRVAGSEDVRHSKGATRHDRHKDCGRSARSHGHLRSGDPCRAQVHENTDHGDKGRAGDLYDMHPSANFANEKQSNLISSARGYNAHQNGRSRRGHSYHGIHPCRSRSRSPDGGGSRSRPPHGSTAASGDSHPSRIGCFAGNDRESDDNVGKRVAVTHTSAIPKSALMPADASLVHHLEASARVAQRQPELEPPVIGATSSLASAPPPLGTEAPGIHLHEGSRPTHLASAQSLVSELDQGRASLPVPACGGCAADPRLSSSYCIRNVARMNPGPRGPSLIGSSLGQSEACSRAGQTVTASQIGRPSDSDPRINKATCHRFPGSNPNGPRPKRTPSETNLGEPAAKPHITPSSDGPRIGQCGAATFPSQCGSHLRQTGVSPDVAQHDWCPRRRQSSAQPPDLERNVSPQYGQFSADSHLPQYDVSPNLGEPSVDPCLRQFSNNIGLQSHGGGQSESSIGDVLPSRMPSDPRLRREPMERHSVQLHTDPRLNQRVADPCPGQLNICPALSQPSADPHLGQCGVDQRSWITDASSPRPAPSPASAMPPPASSLSACRTSSTTSSGPRNVQGACAPPPLIAALMKRGFR